MLTIVEFMQWALPRLGLRWPGFRRVRRQVERRIKKRMTALGIQSFEEYQERLGQSPGEWSVLDSLCQVTISRFYRDRQIFDRLRSELLPGLCARAVENGESELVVWSLGCASGEEPYTLAMIWQEELAQSYPNLQLKLHAMEASEDMLERAAQGIYPDGCLKDLPVDWKAHYFAKTGDDNRLINDRLKPLVQYRQGDVREILPAGQCHLILCRNLAFTYFEKITQKQTARRLVERLQPGGYLVVGNHEQVDEFKTLGLTRLPSASFYQKNDHFTES